MLWIVILHTFHTHLQIYHTYKRSLFTGWLSHLSTNLYTFSPIYTPIYLLTYLLTYRPSHLSTHLAINLASHLSAYLLTYLHTYIPSHLSTYLRTNLHRYLRNNTCCPTKLRSKSMLELPDSLYWQPLTVSATKRLVRFDALNL